MERGVAMASMAPVHRGSDGPGGVSVVKDEIGVGEASEFRVVLVRLLRQIRARSGHELTSSQSSVLARVEQCGPLRMGALADAEGMSPATISRLIDGLVQMDLIERIADPEDGRASLVRVSPEGDALLAEVRARGTLLLRAALNRLNPSEREVLRGALPALEALTDQLQAGGDEVPLAIPSGRPVG